MAIDRSQPSWVPNGTVTYNRAFVNDEVPLTRENRDEIPSSSTTSRHTDEISTVFYETNDPVWVQYGQKLMKLILLITLLFIVSTTASMSVLCFQLAIKGLTVANRSININNTTLGHLRQYCTLKSYKTDDGQIQQGPFDEVLPSETQLDFTLNYNTNSSVPWLWALMFMMMGPEVLGFLYSLKAWYSSKEPNQHRLGPLNHLAIIGAVEGLQVLATGLLAYYILPNFCGVTNVMLLNCTAIVPSIIKFISNAKRLKRLWPILTGFFIVVGQCLCPLCTFGPWQSRLKTTVLAPMVTVCLIIVSITYWTNFIPSETQLPAKVNTIFKAYRRNTRNPAVQLVLCSSKIAWIFGVMIIGTLTLGNVSTVADLFRFSAWSGSNLNINGIGSVNSAVNATCNSKFNQNFTVGNCYQQCNSTCRSFMEPCTEGDKDCLLYCTDACQPCHRTRPPSTTTETTVKSSAKPYAASLVSSSKVNQVSSTSIPNTGHTSTSFYKSTFSASVLPSHSSTFSTSNQPTFSTSSQRAGSRATNAPLITVNLTCNSETLQSKLCQQTCITTGETSVNSTMILNFDCQVYNPPTAGNNVISGVWLTLLMQIGCSWLCYGAAVLGCKVGIQQAVFALPLVLFVPLISVICTGYFTFLGTQFFTFDFFPTLLFKVDDNTVELPYSPFPMYSASIAAMIFWYVSFVALTLYAWSPTEERLAKVWKLFTQPSFWSFAIDKALLLSRKHEFVYKDQVVSSADPVDRELGKIKPPSVVNLVPLNDEKEQIHPKIYVCGTLWHEEPEEMKSLLTSVLRLNHDQTLRQLVHDPKFRQEYSEILKDIDDKDYYELEFDLVFDDGFLPVKEEENPKGKVLTMNTYVKKWCQVVAETLTEVNGSDKGVKPRKYHTPYGGRLVWHLKGGNILNVHLKNKQEIRYKKRWSQVMYMYYALDFLMKQEFGHDHGELEKRLHNTYLLTLDGDVDFHPIAVTRLIDLMKKNDHVGSVCGRIHPLGSGPMIWYQMFEYAVGHWFQKAAEHVFGCVLCSPGCFALFRGAAVVEAMETYATVSENAMDFLQKDQGEDRWLCTLLLQNGWRIEYCAASDARTYAPEELSVFFGQRKRWTPSTLANQMDLLNSYSEVIEKNASMTMSFMAYQLFMMVCTVIGTGSIFLMLFGSLSTIFLINDVLSLFINLVVVVIYSLVCYYCTEKVQLQVTQFLSLIYGLLMIAVLVAICIQGVEEGPTSPNTLFLIIMVACFLVGGLAHPQEFLCLAPGILYFAAIPCTYMLLNIYTVCNCHKVNWGTREAPNADAKLEQMKAQEQPAMSKIESTYKNYISYIGTFFATICCRQDQKRMDQTRIKMLEDQLAVLTLKTDQIINGRNTEKKIDEQRPAAAPTSLQRHKLPSPILKNGPFVVESETELMIAKKNYRCHSLSSDEEEYWTNFVQTKLFALIEDKNKKKVKEDQLLALRAKSMTFFYLLNAFYVLIIFLLQLYTDLLNFNWPFTPCTWDYDRNPNLVKECSLDQALHYEGRCCKYCSNSTAPYYSIEANSTLDDCKNDYLEKELCGCLEIEPVTIVVIVFFLSLLVVQFIGLIFHRIETGMVVVATTPFMEQNKGKVTLPDLLDAVCILDEMSNYEGEDDRQPSRPKGLRRGYSFYRKRLSTIHLNESLPTIQENEIDKNYDPGFFQRSSVAQQEFQKDEIRRKRLTGLTRSQNQYRQLRQKINSINDKFNKQSSYSADVGLKRQPSVVRISMSQVNLESDEDDDVFEKEDVVKLYVENKYGPKKLRRGTINAINALVEDKRERTSSFRK